MKKLLLIPAVIGLVAVPSLVMAQNGADDAKPNTVRQEDRREDRKQENKKSSGESALESSIRALQENANNLASANNSPSTVVAPPAGLISLSDAQAIAQAQFPDKTIRKVEAETEHGILVYSVRFTDGSRVDVSAADGSIVKSESESDDNEDRSDHSERHSESDDD